MFVLTSIAFMVGKKKIISARISFNLFIESYVMIPIPSLNASITRKVSSVVLGPF